MILGTDYYQSSIRMYNIIITIIVLLNVYISTNIILISIKIQIIDFYEYKSNENMKYILYYNKFVESLA